MSPLCRWGSDKNLIREQINIRLSDVKSRIAKAAELSGRDERDVLLVAVSKYASPDDGVVEGFLNSGVFELAENRPQNLVEKVEFWNRSQYWDAFHSPIFISPRERETTVSLINWHFIGHLQRNKARRILPYVSLIHSVDTFKLLVWLEQILEEESQKNQHEGDSAFPERVSVLLEVHISGDETKQGFSFEELERILPNAFELKHIEICGLMGMSGLKSSPSEKRSQFEQLRCLLERLQTQYPENTRFRELSMGMSDDFELAIAEGATIVRIGSVLYPQEC